MESTSFKVINNGIETIYEVIATYHDDETNKDFMVYTDMSLTSDKELKLYYSLYKNADNGINIINVESPEDKKIGLQLVREILKDLK